MGQQTRPPNQPPDTTDGPPPSPESRPRRPLTPDTFASSFGSSTNNIKRETTDDIHNVLARSTDFPEAQTNQEIPTLNPKLKNRLDFYADSPSTLDMPLDALIDTIFHYAIRRCGIKEYEEIYNALVKSNFIQKVVGNLIKQAVEIRKITPPPPSHLKEDSAEDVITFLADYIDQNNTELSSYLEELNITTDLIEWLENTTHKEKSLLNHIESAFKKKFGRNLAEHIEKTIIKERDRLCHNVLQDCLTDKAPYFDNDPSKKLTLKKAGDLIRRLMFERGELATPSIRGILYNHIIPHELTQLFPNRTLEDLDNEEKDYLVYKVERALDEFRKVLKPRIYKFIETDPNTSTPSSLPEITELLGNSSPEMQKLLNHYIELFDICKKEQPDDDVDLDNEDTPYPKELPPKGYNPAYHRLMKTWFNAYNKELDEIEDELEKYFIAANRTIDKFLHDYLKGDEEPMIISQLPEIEEANDVYSLLEFLSYPQNLTETYISRKAQCQNKLTQLRAAQNPDQARIKQFENQVQHWEEMARIPYSVIRHQAIRKLVLAILHRTNTMDQKYANAEKTRDKIQELLSHEHIELTGKAYLNYTIHENGQIKSTISETPTENSIELKKCKISGYVNLKAAAKGEKTKIEAFCFSQEKRHILGLKGPDSLVSKAVRRKEMFAVIKDLIRGSLIVEAKDAKKAQGIFDTAFTTNGTHRRHNPKDTNPNSSELYRENYKWNARLAIKDDLGVAYYGELELKLLTPEQLVRDQAPELESGHTNYNHRKAVDNFYDFLPSSIYHRFYQAVQTPYKKYNLVPKPSNQIAQMPLERILKPTVPPPASESL